MLLTRPILAFTRKINCIDHPKDEGHKTHTRPTPLAGGLIIASLLLIIILGKPELFTGDLAYILGGGLLIGAAGFIDDLYGLRARWKLLGQVIGISVLLLGKVHVHIFSTEFLNYAITFFWILGITNAFNLIDGLDGLATGLASIACALIAFCCIGSGQLQLAFVATTLLASVSWLYYLNIMPAKLFLGDAGSQMLGFIIATLLIAYHPPGFSIAHYWFLPVMFMGVIIFDTTLVVLSRLFNHQAIYLGNRDHTHHRLVHTGMSPNRAALTIHLVSAAVSILGFVAVESTPLTGNLIFTATCSTGLGIIFFLNRKQIKALISK